MKMFLKSSLVLAGLLFCSLAAAQSTVADGQVLRPIAEEEIYKINIQELTEKGPILLQVEFGREVEVDCLEYLQGSVTTSTFTEGCNGAKTTCLSYVGSGQIVDRQIGCPNKESKLEFVSLSSQWVEYKKNTTEKLNVRMLKDRGLIIRYRVVHVSKLEPVVVSD